MIFHTRKNPPIQIIHIYEDKLKRENVWIIHDILLKYRK